jgi:hypothetical protein
MNKAEEIKQQFISDWCPNPAHHMSSKETDKKIERFKHEINELLDKYAQQVKKETVNELFEAFGNFCKAINEQNQEDE